MKRRAFLVAGPALAAAAAILWMAVRPAQGQGDQRLDALGDALGDFDRMFIETGRWAGPRPEMPAYLRWDALRTVGSVQFNARRFTYFDSQSSWFHRRSSHQPHEWTEFYGPVVDSAIAELWTEVRAGLPNTTFTPVQRGPEWKLPWCMPADLQWRVGLPFSWANAWEIYTTLNADGLPTCFGLWDPGSQGWTLGPMAVNISWDVPLLDDFHSRESPWPVPPQRWHEEAAVHSRFTFDLASSPTAQSLHLDPERPRGPYTVAAHYEDCVAGQDFVAPVHIEHTWNAATALSGDRAVAAMAAGCTLRLELGGQLKYSLPVGAQAGFAGTVELRDGAGTVLRSHELSSSLSAPTKRAERNGMHTKTTTLPSGNHDALRLVIDGQLYAQCSQDGEWLLTAIRGSVPELDWTGCWPELGVIN